MLSTTLETPVAVLVTRPEPQAHTLAASLASGGMQPFVFPVLTIEPRVLESREHACIDELDRYQAVFCISAHAALLGVELCADRWPQWPARQTWYAVGPASGRPLAGRGLDLVVSPAGSTSETLLARPELQRLEGQRCLILRGVGGRETLADTLRLRGAQVDYLELYERRSASPSPAVLKAFLACPRGVITCTSGETLDALLQQAGTSGAALQARPLVVVSGRLADHARARGFSTLVVADGAGDAALADAVARAAPSTDTSTGFP